MDPYKVNDILDIRTGDIIGFNYRNRHVKAEVLRIDIDRILGSLLTEYIGRIEDWSVGDIKNFDWVIMKKIYIIKRQKL